jgi:hypothetical protein
MNKTPKDYDVIVDFWEWYGRRKARHTSALASLALDRCEQAIQRCQWDNFGYWHAIYIRERQKAQAAPPTKAPKC